MKISRVNEQLTVSGQLEESDVAQLAADGVEVIVCNRPDNESLDQTPFQKIAAAAKKFGIEAELIPFKSGAMGDEHVREFSRILESRKKIHCYCRSGTRSFGLYAATLATKGGSWSEILEQSERLGFDVSEILSLYYPEN